MAVPKRKTSPSRRGMRRSADALKRADLCRGQGFRRAAPAAPHRPQDRHVPRPPGAQGQERSLTAGRLAPVGWARRALALPCPRGRRYREAGRRGHGAVLIALRDVTVGPRLGPPYGPR